MTTVKTSAKEGKSLASAHPELAKEYSLANETPANAITLGSNKSVEWIGSDCGHKWEAAVKTRVRGSTCPYCSNRRILAGFNDAATAFPELIEDYSSTNAKTLQELAPGSKLVVDWKCHRCDHTWSTELKNRTNKGSGCPSCGQGTRTIPKARYTELTPQLSGRNGDVSSIKMDTSNLTPVWWKCDQGHEWKASPRNRLRGSNCPTCYHNRSATRSDGKV